MKRVVWGFVSLGVAGGIAAALWVWTGVRDSEPAPPANLASAMDQSLGEAPCVAERVGRGEPPPVAQRLPVVPLVVQAITEEGDYGGDWRVAVPGRWDASLLYRTIGYENLVRWTPEWTHVVPNVVQSYSVSPDHSAFTFRLRRGMRWSDGAPFTADDILFWYEDVVGCPELCAVPPAWLVSAGRPARVEKLDDYTVRFSLAQPDYVFLQRLARPAATDVVSFPRHYLSKFHVRYNSDGLAEQMQAAGVATWPELFRLKGGAAGSPELPSRWRNPELPTLNAWVLTAAPAAGDGEVVAVRNPYYWKIDLAGRQLPYLERVVMRVTAAGDTVLAQLRRGEISMQSWHAPVGLGSPSAQAEAEALGYTVRELFPTVAAEAAVYLNLTPGDPGLRLLTRNRDFRIGLSLAIDRPTIIREVYGGDADAAQVAPRPESPFYNDHMARQYTAYDVERANQHLDKAGCTLRDLSGFRLRPDGRRVALVIEVADTPVQSAWPAVAERVCAAWRDVGVEASLRVQDADALFWRRLSNAFDAVVCEGGSGVAVQVEPAYYLPASPLRSSFAPGWAYWYLAPSHPLAEEPPAPARLQLALYEKAKATTDEPERIRLMNQILTICQNEFYGIGICRARQGRAVIHRDFRNVPALMSCGWEFPDPAPGNSCQFYLAPAGRGAVAGPDRGE